MAENKNYHDELNKKNILKLRELLAALPPFCKQFFRGIENTTASRTRIAYAYDLGVSLNSSMRRTAYTGKGYR